MADLKKFLDTAGVTHLWSRVTAKITEEADRAKLAEKAAQDAANAAQKDATQALADAATAKQTADAKVASVAKGNNGITIAGTATAPTVGVQISAEAGNDLVIKEDGLFVEVPAAAEYTVVKDENAGSYAAVYHLTKDGVNVGAAINIPKDMVVKEGRVENGNIVLVLNNDANTEITIPASDLIEYVTGGTTSEIVVTVDEQTHVVTATLVDGSIAKAKLAAAVQTTLNLADTALQAADITTGNANGTIAVEGNDVAVKGLGTAAFQNVEAFDAKGDAAQALVDAKAYADGLAGNYDAAGSAAQALADAKTYADTEINSKVIALTTTEIDNAIGYVAPQA